jgi:hypothetical protein
MHAVHTELAVLLELNVERIAVTGRTAAITAKPKRTSSAGIRQLHIWAAREGDAVPVRAFSWSMPNSSVNVWNPYSAVLFDAAQM